MKRRSKVSGERAKAQGRGATKLTYRSASKRATRHIPFAACEHTEVAGLTLELNEALERQAVTSEPLGIISSGAAEQSLSSAPFWKKLRASVMPRWGTSIGGMLNIPNLPRSALWTSPSLAIGTSADARLAETTLLDSSPLVGVAPSLIISAASLTEFPSDGSFPR
jgi:hypothetical protein